MAHLLAAAVAGGRSKWQVLTPKGLRVPQTNSRSAHNTAVTLCLTDLPVPSAAMSAALSKIPGILSCNSILEYHRTAVACTAYERGEQANGRVSSRRVPS